MLLTRGPGRLLPSDSASVLKYGSGHSSDFLDKMLSVDSLWFVIYDFNHKSRKRTALFAYVADSRGSIPTMVLF
jgi:hypothetical protein